MPLKSVWGVIHKMSPDQSALHVLGTGGRAKRKPKLKRSTKTVTGT